MDMDLKRWAAKSPYPTISSKRTLALKRRYYAYNRAKILAALKEKRDAERGGPPRPWIRADARPTG